MNTATMTTTIMNPAFANHHSEKSPVAPKATAAKVAVSCTDISFSYTSDKPVLTKLSMTVPQSSIYSLLGASSSGKTTLIKIITGTLKASSGSVTIFGQKLGTSGCSVPGTGVGVMPQELAIYPHFSVASTLRYFGRLNRLSELQISERISYLREYLELPDTGRPVATLSGGQQRRVSLAVALLHSPALVVLDEPTVGIDPLLRFKIWSLLGELKDHGHTIIVTTHYIEETVTSDTVSFMRNGRLLCEENPQYLIASTASVNLEEALYRLCKQQDTALSHNGHAVYQQPQLCQKSLPAQIEAVKQKIKSVKEVKVPAEKQERRHTSTPSCSFFSLTAFSAVSRRTWKLMIADKLNLFLMLIYPSIVLYMISVSFHQLPAVDVAVLNTDQSVSGETSLLANQTRSFASQLVSSMENSVNLHAVNTTSQVVNLIESGICTAGLTFAGNFTECFEQRIEAGMLAPDEVLDCAQARLHLDNTHFIRFWIFAFSMANGFKKAIFEYFPPLGINPLTLLPPLNFLDAVTGEEMQFKFAMESFFVSGQITGINFMLTLLMSGLVWLKDRASGVFERSAVHGVSQTTFFVCHLSVQATIMAASNCLFIAVAVWLFDVRLSGNGTVSILTAYLLLYLQSVSTIILGQLVALTSSCHMTYLTKMAMLVFPLFFASGTLWPLESLNSPLLQALMGALPLTRPTTAMRSLISRQLPFTSPQVYGGFLVLAGYTLLFLVACLYRLRWW